MTSQHRGAEGVSLDDPAATLAQVDEVLGAVCDSVERGWSARTDEPPDILADDLPTMLRSRLLPGAGKRLRPVMCHWGWVAAGGSRVPDAGDGRGYAEMVASAAALDLVHLFALVHDDVMDRSEERRGLPAAHVEARTAHDKAGALGDAALFGDSVAVLLGDLALAEAGDLVAMTGPRGRALWREILRELVHGQLLDVTGAAARRRDVEFGRRVARLKSGAYTIQRPLLLGAAAAGADAQVTAALSRYGEHLGEAFALRDDLLGVWGDPLVTGKPAGDDLLSGKATVLLALGRQRLPQAESERLLGPNASISARDVPGLQRLLVDSGVRDEVEQRISELGRTAVEALHTAPLDDRGLEELTALVDVVSWRSA